MKVNVVERREQEGREHKKTEFLAPVLPTASSENLNHDLSFLISLWKQDNSSCAANSIDLQDGSKEIEDLEKLWEVKTVFQRITITLELSGPEWLNQVIVLEQSFFFFQRVRHDHGRLTLPRPCIWMGPMLLRDTFSDKVSKWLRHSKGRRKLWHWQWWAGDVETTMPRTIP